MRLISILFFLSLSFLAVSQSKVIHDGEACYLHVVEKGNTLYGISKQYAVTIPELLSMNPQASIGLSIGQKIYVPLSAVNRKEAKRSPELDGNVLVHKVSKKETLYSLGKKYKVDINAILESNPELEENGLKKGASIKIPVNAVKVDQSFKEPAAKDSLLHHEVLLGETLYSLSKNYQVSIDSIKNVNGGLSEGLRAGMTLRIPKYVTGFSPAVVEAEADEVETDSKPLVRNPRLDMSVGLLLPFSLSLSDSTESSVPRGSDDVLKLTDIAYEFYRGVQLGMDELSSFGLDADVVVMDVTGERKTVDRCLNSQSLEDLDIIIGPLHKESFEMISSDGRLTDVFRASPLSGSLDVSSGDDKNVSKLRPSDNVLIRSIVNDIRSEHSSDNVVLISGDIRSWHENFESEWGRDSLAKDIKHLRWDKSAHAELLALLDKEGPNVLVYPVEHRPSITDLISNLATSEFRNLDITLYGLEQWMKYDNLDADVLDRVNLHIPVSQYIDWEREDVVDFVRKFKDEFNTIPSSAGYGLLGYDIVKFYLEGMMMYGPEFLESQDQLQREGLVSGFKMKRAGIGGWVNEFAYMLEYKNHQFTVLQ